MNRRDANGLRWLVFAFAGLFLSPDARNRAWGDGPPPYPGGPTTYESVAVPDRFNRLLGVWKGPFRAYDLSAKAFRPYEDVLTFSSDKCIKVTNGTSAGDILLVGTLNDQYPEFRTPAGDVLPAKSETGYLVYGLKGGDPNQVFVRSVEGGSTAMDYAPEYALEAAEAFVYRAVVPASGTQPQMTFRLFGAQDPLADDDSRYFTITLTVGPDDHPYWQGIIVGGRQAHQPPGAATGLAGSTAAPTPPVPGKSTSGSPAGAMDVHKAMGTLHQHETARRGIRGLMTTIPPG